ncbi:hypothetical protein [Hymenobacter sp. UYCo722]|uniref:hypothetical protein n=1 Tax=Hymenobacter sp. UYCo722 TaxID=3156335 RepID=UPI0033939B40
MGTLTSFAKAKQEWQDFINTGLQPEVRREQLHPLLKMRLAVTGVGTVLSQKGYLRKLLVRGRNDFEVVYRKLPPPVVLFCCCFYHEIVLNQHKTLPSHLWSIEYLPRSLARAPNDLYCV